MNYSDEWLTILGGDCREVLRTLPASSVHCIITSPPYWGLRDYGTASWTGGDEDCDHLVGPLASSKSGLQGGSVKDTDKIRTNGMPFRGDCGKCGATRQDSQLGLEATPEEYVATMVDVFREVRRVLRDDGTLWLNLGDSYMAAQGGRQSAAGLMPLDTKRTSGRATIRTDVDVLGWGERDVTEKVLTTRDVGLKPKDLVGIPWRVAFALQQPYYTGIIPDERNRTWLAALLDGEGTFTILSTTSPHGSGNSYPPIAQVRMTSQGVVQKAASLVGVASPAQYPPSAGGNRGVYQWRLSGARAANIAREMYPYLIEKRKQALIAWNHQVVRESYETKRGVTIPTVALEKQKVARDLIRRLNRGEHVDVPSWMVDPPGMTEPGWYLRSDVIWSKPNPMPESVTDRPTKSHEYLFLLSKSSRYFFDADAVRETRDPTEVEWSTKYSATLLAASARRSRDQEHIHPGRNGDDPRHGGLAKYDYTTTGRNIRSVWTIATAPYPGAHFATFPPKLVEPCVKAGTSERGVCPECGAPWERIIVKVGDAPHFDRFGRQVERRTQDHWKRNGDNRDRVNTSDGVPVALGSSVYETTGWRPTCLHVRCSDCASITSYDKRVANLPRVRSGVSDPAGSPEHLLLSDVREPGDGAYPSDDEGLRDDDPWLSSDLQAEPSGGVEDGLRLGASAGDGDDPWASAPTVGSDPSPEWQQERQPAREPGGSDEEGARRAVEPRTAADGDMPGLRQPLPAAGQCRQCGGDLLPLEPVPAQVLDCFAGTGTVGMVAQSLSRKAVLIDLNPDYLRQCLSRNAQTPLGI